MKTFSIDHARLERVRTSGTKLQSRCPACHAVGNDRAGEHLFLNLQTGAWGCTVFPGDGEHRKEIFALVGVKSDRPPASTSTLRQNAAHERAEAEKRAHSRQSIIDARKAFMGRWGWGPVAVWEDSPQIIDQPLVEYDPRFFIQSLFAQNAIVWTGEVFHSGTRHADHFRTTAEWQAADEHSVGPMISPAIWKPGAVNRTAENVLSSPFVILDFDELDCAPPSTPEAIEELQRFALTTVRWLRSLGWNLAAIVHTGNKSLHCWFQDPGKAALTSLREMAPALGIDAGLIGQPSHPCRLPGQKHAKSGGMSRVLWLQTPLP